MDKSTEFFFQGITDSQLQLIDSILNVALEEVDKEVSATQIREIVPLEKWLNYQHFLGPFARDLFPYWKTEIINYMNTKAPELILSGAIGTGKSTSGLIVAIRKLYELSCFDKPQRLFGLSDITDIFFAYLSINYRHAERTGYGQLRSMLDAIPYFQKEFPRDTDIDSVLKFPSKLMIMPGSDNLSVISTNLFGCIMDEADFYRRGSQGAAGDIERANTTYFDITTRRMSRFMIKGYDPGFSILISSSNFQSSFVSSRIKKADGKSSYVNISRLWDTKPNNYNKETFLVFKGSEKDDAFVVNSTDDFIQVASDDLKQKIKVSVVASNESGETLLEEVYKSLPLEFRNNFIKIPVDFRKSFDDDVYTSLKNIGGVSVAPTGKLFTSHAVWQMNIKSHLRHPFTKLEFVISMRGTEQVIDFLDVQQLFEKVGEAHRCRRHPNAPRFFHIDQSTGRKKGQGDSTGIGCVHLADMIVDKDTMLSIPKVELDFAIRILAPKPPDKISIAKCRKFIFDLRLLGMIIGKVSYDQFASPDSIQIMQTNRITAEYRSVDRTDSAYLQFIQLLYENRFDMYDYFPFKEEVFNLNHDVDARKVDHPETLPDGRKGSKDITDGVVGAIANALEKAVVQERTVDEILNDMTFTGSNKEENKEAWVFADYKPGKNLNKITGFINDANNI